MPQYKGIDDLLAAGERPRRIAGQQVAEFFGRLDRIHHGNDARAANSTADPPSRRDTLPAFPVNIFPETVSRFVRQVADSTGCPLDFPAVAVLVVAAAAIGAARAIQLKRGWVEQPGMYAAIVAKPGRAKTPVIKAVMTPIYEEQDRLRSEYRAALAQHRTELAAFKRAERSGLSSLEDLFEEPAGPPSPPPPMQHLFTTDATTESLAVILESNRKGVLCIHDELAAWVKGMNQYRRGADRQFYLSAWSNAPIKVDRKTSEDGPIIVSHPFVCVLGGVQPDLLPTLETGRGVEDGFLDRLLFAYPAEQRFQGWNNQELDEDSADDWRLILNRLLALFPQCPEGGADTPQIVPLSDGGRQRFADYIDALAAEINAAESSSRTEGFCAKLRGYAARFALVIHLLRWAADELDDSCGEGDVDAEDVRRAVLLCNYFRAHAGAVHACLSTSPEDKQVQALLAWMARRGMTETTPREVSRANVAGITNTRDARTLLASAAEQGYGCLEVTGNRSSNVRFFLSTTMIRNTDSDAPSPTPQEAA